MDEVDINKKTKNAFHVSVPRRVPLELLDLQHARVLPEAQLVLAEAVGRHELLVVLRPLEGAHLRCQCRTHVQGEGSQHRTRGSSTADPRQTP